MRDDIEKRLADLRRRTEETEAEATHAAEGLMRLCSGLTPLAEVDPDAVRATADTFAGAVQRLRLLADHTRDLRGLLI